MNTGIDCDVLIDIQFQLASLKHDVDELKLNNTQLLQDVDEIKIQNQKLNKENTLLKNDFEEMKERNQLKLNGICSIENIKND